MDEFLMHVVYDYMLNPYVMLQFALVLIVAKTIIWFAQNGMMSCLDEEP